MQKLSFRFSSSLVDLLPSTCSLGFRRTWMLTSYTWVHSPVCKKRYTRHIVRQEKFLEIYGLLQVKLDLAHREKKRLHRFHFFPESFKLIEMQHIHNYREQWSNKNDPTALTTQKRMCYWKIEKVLYLGLRFPSDEVQLNTYKKVRAAWVWYFVPRCLLDPKQQMKLHLKQTSWLQIPEITNRPESFVVR